MDQIIIGSCPGEEGHISYAEDIDDENADQHKLADVEITIGVGIVT